MKYFPLFDHGRILKAIKYENSFEVPKQLSDKH